MYDKVILHKTPDEPFLGGSGTIHPVLFAPSHHDAVFTQVGGETEKGGGGGGGSGIWRLQESRSMFCCHHETKKKKEKGVLSLGEG